MLFSLTAYDTFGVELKKKKWNKYWKYFHSQRCCCPCW